MKTVGILKHTGNTWTIDAQPHVRMVLRRLFLAAEKERSKVIEFSDTLQNSEMLAWFVVVAPWEQAIRVRLGKHTTKLHAGIYLRIPFVDRVFKQSIRRRLSIIRAQTLTTADGKVITCAGALGFAIGDLEKLYDTLESPNDTLENEVAAIISRFIGGAPLKDCTSPKLEEYVRENLDLTRYGLIGQEFYTTSFATAKTYRFVTGDMSVWSHDRSMKMDEESRNG